MGDGGILLGWESAISREPLSPDLQDMSPMLLSCNGPDKLFDSHKLVLNVSFSDSKRVRVFCARGGNSLSDYKEVLGPQRRSYKVERQPGEQEIRFYVEGLTFPDDDFLGLVSLSVSLVDARALLEVTLFTDTVAFRMTPWIMTPNTQPPEELYVCSPPQVWSAEVGTEAVSGLRPSLRPMDSWWAPIRAELVVGQQQETYPSCDTGMIPCLLRTWEPMSGAHGKPHLSQLAGSSAISQNPHHALEGSISLDWQSPARPLCQSVVDEHGSNEKFLEDMSYLTLKASCKLVICPWVENRNDRWIQDEMEFGYIEAPHKSFPVVFDSPRNRGLRDFPYKRVLGPDFGYVTREIPSATPSSLDSFGNLDVSPPVTVGGMEYPLGRILIGSSFPK
ncbi:Protein-arginine deiminase type-1 [Saguinus oedipus]|uniref:Protein-arginine deiminase type-1 n=1 Tax=Saguinus oedipus TaxID=9490 RepID=A0ABQ9V9J9_SAGOE|nr:Protein-arginine deiminase type-1 [Saguinus oedipus]